jgi:quercetin 2,3-dioxygenase
MLTLRSARERGRTRIGWLDSRHSFSFGEYYDPAQMGFRALRVINEDRVEPGAGFPTHGHHDMEIISYVLDGGLAHQDSLGTGSIIRPGEVQRMSAGTGIRHSEFNASKTEPVHFLQIWIEPEREGLAPSYEQKAFDLLGVPGRLHLVGARDGRGGAITIHQDVTMHAGVLRKGDSIDYAPAPGRHVWVQIAHGTVALNGQAMSAGDGAAASQEPRLRLAASADSEIVLFDLA